LIKPENFNILQPQACVLVAPLDWGLGHATRCIPVISELIKQHCIVFVAAEGQVKILIQKEFPDIPFIELPGYRIQYSRHPTYMPVKLLLQLPKILYRIYAENHWLKKAVKAYSIDAVISDNRMGLFHTKIPCVYITHQLTIKTGNHFTESIAQKIHYHFINKFRACWVPDANGASNLAGALSHPAVVPKVPVIYLGPLSRFEKKEAESKYDLCILLSGPEPQRTVFEKMILRDLNQIQGKICLVRGLPQETQVPLLNNSFVEIINHLPADGLNQMLLQSDIIISRCGYSTVMDLVKLQKKAILVPTPGQTEQEYLGRRLLSQKIFYCVDQKHFSLPDALKKAADFEFHVCPVIEEDYKIAVENFTTDLKAHNAGI
jgi:uncharacterized protein (TIGR00661 family)